MLGKRGTDVAEAPDGVAAQRSSDLARHHGQADGRDEGVDRLRDEDDAVLGVGGGPGFFDPGEGDGAGVDVDGAGGDLPG